jgi:RHS repeat-associated protein
VLRYASYCYDPESGLYYLSARSYDPQTRQFLSKDDAKADGEESEYQYCGGNPARVDPSGDHEVTIEFAQSKSDHRQDWSNYLVGALERNAGYVQNMMWDNIGAYWYWHVYGDIETYEWWVDMVSSGHDWDLKLAVKPKERAQAFTPFCGHYISPEDFGNINYGYTGAAIWIPPEILDLGSRAVAGWAGLTDASKFENENVDEVYVNWGWSLYQWYGAYYTGTLVVD